MSTRENIRLIARAPLVGIPTKILKSQLLDALNYQTCLFIDNKTLSS